MSDKGLSSLTAGNPALTSLLYGVIDGNSRQMTVDQVLALVGSASTGFTQSGTAAVNRTWTDKARDIYSALDFIPESEHAAIRNYTSTTDLATYVQAAIDAASSTGIGLYFPAGRYRIGSAIAIDTPGRYWGEGEATLIQTTSATANIFTVSAEFVDIEGFRFSSSVTRTDGWYVDFVSANRSSLSHFHMEGAIGGVRINVTASVSVQHGAILNSVASTGVPIRVNGGADLTIADIIADNASETFAGIYVTDTDDLTIHQCNLINSGQAIYLEPAAGQVIASVWASQTFCDNSTRGLYVNANGGSVVRCKFDGCWFSSNTNEGVRAQITSGTVDGLEFNHCQAHLNGGNGYAVVSSGVENFKIFGGTAAQNTGDGVNIAAGASEFSIIGLRAGATHGLTGNANGIVVASGASDNYTITLCDLRGNTSAALSDGGSGTNKTVAHNRGASDVLDGILGMTTGIIVKTSSTAVLPRSIIAPAAGISVSNGDGVAGNMTLALANDLSALEGLSSTGFAVRTTTDTWAQRSLTAPAAGLTISNNDGVSGNPTFALANDLAALEALSGTSTIYYRSGTDTWSAVTIGGNLGFSGGTLGSSLGTAATKNTGTSGNTVPLLDGSNAWSAQNTYTVSNSGTSSVASVTATLNRTTTSGTGGIFSGLELDVNDNGSTAALSIQSFRLVYTNNNSGDAGSSAYDSACSLNSVFNNSLSSQFRAVDIPGANVAAGKTVATWSAVYIANGSGAGTVTNRYGVVSEASSGNWGVKTTTPASDLEVVGTVQMDALRIDQAASTIGTGAKTISNAADSSTNFGKYFSINLNGTVVYIPCGTVAPT